MKASVLIKAIVLYGIALSASAEGGCPPGMIPYRGSDVASCGPIPTSGNDVPSGPVWSNRWGAVASDPNTGVMGAVANRRKRDVAERAAIKECESRGGISCLIETSYSNQCLVTIQGKTGVTHSKSSSVEQAEKLGMDACAKRGDPDCHVYYQACSLPVRIQ